ncbi:MAG: chromate efflux transporter [Clostridiales bacterium]|nr:chromate efflux transporter [Clostridiales bacterium]MCF8022938.1 chromate efflux transporter [Clostridiales bacterium]
MTEKARAKFEKVPLHEIGFTFLRIGIVSFSLAALGEARNWLVKEKNWFTDEEYLQGVGFSQVLPGAPAVSLMIYLGHRLRGFWGSVFSCAGYLLPAFVFMLLTTYLYMEYQELAIISNLFRGLEALVTGLVINTVINLWQSGVKVKQNWILGISGFILIYFLQLSIYWILLAGIVTSTFFMLLSKHSSWWARNMAEVSNNDFQQENNTTPVNWKKIGITAGLVAAVLAGNIILINMSDVFTRLGTTFMELGGLVFGSGYAMLPFIQEEAIDTYHWITTNQFTAALALSLITPGPLTKIAAFIGFKAAGLAGAVVATINIYIPTFCIINLLADFYRRAGEIMSMRIIVRGVLAAFIGTLWAVVIRLSTDILVDIPTMLMALGAVAVQRFTNIDTLWVVLIGAAVSVLLF